MTPEQGVRRLAQFTPKIEAALTGGLNEAARLVMGRALAWSSGPYTRAMQRRMYDPFGPYSKADPHPPADEGLINVQERRLVRAWELEEAARRNGKLTASVFNTSREAAYMGHWDGDRWVQGPNSKMIARPLPERVLEEVAPVFDRIMERQVFDAVKALISG